MSNGTIPIVIIGAGPYGLALSAHCRHLGIDHVLFGEPMSLWRENMPSDMLLRSHFDWHLDPLEEFTIDAYAAQRGTTGQQLEPIALTDYLDYAEQFQRARDVVADPRKVTRLDKVDSPTARFAVTLSDGTRLTAERVVVASGVGDCAQSPAELATAVGGRFTHSVRFVDFDDVEGKTFLIVGGRQSAFEYAALAVEHGAAHVHLAYRHETPRFADADWRWVAPLLARFDTDPRWYHELPEAGREEITQHMWRIGRQQLEPWLGPRIERPGVSLWPNSLPSGVVGDDPFRVRLDSGLVLAVDKVVFATGYRMDVARVPFLAAGDVMAGVEMADGIPVLDEHFRTSAPGLYFTNKFAARDFGHFFDFTAGVRVSARAITSDILAEVAS